MSRYISLLLLIVLISSLNSFEFLKSETFANIKTNNQDKVVCFYKSSDETATPVLTILEEVAKLTSDEFPSFEYYLIDGDSDGSRDDYKEAGFGKGAHVFTSNMESGIQKYPLELKTEILHRHIKSLFMPNEKPELVQKFNGEKEFNLRIKESRPLVVKWYQESCPHCKGFKAPFQKFAQYYEGKVDFMDISCDDNKAFCGKFSLGGYPALLLFVSGKKITFKATDRTFITFDNWINSNIEGGATNTEAPKSASLKSEPVKEAAVASTTSEEFEDQSEDDEIENLKASIKPVASESDTGAVVAETFDNIKSNNQEKLVIFYSSTNPESRKVLDVADEVAKVLHSELPNFYFYKIDGDSEDNRASYKEAGFDKSVHVFTSNMEGIQKYTLEVDTPSLTKHIRSLFIPNNDPDLVLEFSDEKEFNKLAKGDKPLLLEMFKEDCPHCKSFKIPFQRFANHWQEHVTFMAVSCDDNASFCSKFAISGYPGLVLFNKGKKTIFAENSRFFITVEKFLNKRLGLKEIPIVLSPLDDPEGGKSDDHEGHDHSGHNHSHEEAAADELPDDSDSFWKHETMTEIQKNTDDKLVIFYKKSNADKAKEQFDLLESVASELTAEFPNFKFFKVDGDMSQNKKEFNKAKFKAPFHVFTSMREFGIQVFNQAVSRDNLVKHLRSLHFPLEEDDVLEFTSELDFYNLMDLEENPKPIFVKFFTETCPHCQGFKNAFKRYGSLYKDKVTFMDVNCGAGKVGEKFCKTNKATSYPTLILFKGDDKVTFNDDDRTFIAIEKFLVKNANVTFLDVSGGAAKSSASEPTNAVPKAEPSKSATVASKSAPVAPQSAPVAPQSAPVAPKATPSAPKAEVVTGDDEDKELLEELERLKAKEEMLAKKIKAKEEIAALKAKIAQMERDL